MGIDTIVKSFGFFLQKNFIGAAGNEKRYRGYCRPYSIEAWPAYTEIRGQHPLYLWRYKRGAVLPRRFCAMKFGQFRLKRPVVKRHIIIEFTPIIEKRPWECQAIFRNYCY